VKTGCHLTYFGPGRIIISRGNPRGVPGGYKKFMALAPSAEAFRASRERYTELFKAQLSALDPGRTWEELHRLADGAEPVLLCFERPPFTRSNWCHRRMVADWFAWTLGHEVPEIGHDAQQALL
jgi:hypothetical protein